MPRSTPGGPAAAGPASYVKTRAQEAHRADLGAKIQEITDQYILQKGVDPDSTAGQIIEPYVIGTTWVDHLWNIHGVDDRSVDQCVQDSLECPHHSLHFGDGKRIADQLRPPQKSTSCGG